MGSINLQVGASSDDARETSGTVSLTSGQGNTSGANIWLGFRWPSVTVGNAATINSATFRPRIVSTSNDTPNGATVGLEDVDNAAAFTTGTNNLSGRSRPDTVAWSGSNIGAGAHDIDVTAQVQRNVNRAGWASGNAMVCLVRGVSGTDLSLVFYDGTPADAAELIIDYTEVGGRAARVVMSGVLMVNAGGAMVNAGGAMGQQISL